MVKESTQGCTFMTLILTSALTPMMASLPATSQDAAQQRKAAKAKDALAALRTLGEQRSSVGEQRKAAARKKVEDLKARIRSLQMTAGGNPEAIAKIAAQLARELGAAVKAYAEAGGSAAGMGGPSASASQAGEASGDQAPAADASAANAPSAAAEVESGRAAPFDEETSNRGKSEHCAGKDTDPYRQVIERQQARAAEQANRSADREADDKFAADVKGLVAQLKAILHQAAEKAKRNADPSASTDEKSADEALTQVTEALGDMASPLAGVAVGISLQV